MNTWQNLLDNRLAERQDELNKQVQADTAAGAQERGWILALFSRDILKGASLPPGASIAFPVSHEHGHQLVVSFPGRLHIAAERLYGRITADKLPSGQRWVARNLNVNIQKTFTDFVDAALWLFPQLATDVTPKPQPATRCPSCGSVVTPGGGDTIHCLNCHTWWDNQESLDAWAHACDKVKARKTDEKPVDAVLNRLLAAAEGAYLEMCGGNVSQDLYDALECFRCPRCENFPTESLVWGDNGVRCCGQEWDSWDDFLEHKGVE